MNNLISWLLIALIVILVVYFVMSPKDGYMMYPTLAQEEEEGEEGEEGEETNEGLALIGDRYGWGGSPLGRGRGGSPWGSSRGWGRDWGSGWGSPRSWWSSWWGSPDDRTMTVVSRRGGRRGFGRWGGRRGRSVVFV